jgi:hypothetical protein
MDAIFSVQDETGTVAQLTLQASPSPAPAGPVQVGDSGIYEGFPDNGTASFQAPSFQSLHFVVIQVLDNEHFSVSTINANMADWPAFGTITWETGANATETATVIEIDGANAYIDEAFLGKYCASRGIVIPPAKTVDDVRAAIVQGTDYLDQKYRYNGVKRLQTIGSAIMDANSTFLETWLTPYALQGVSYLTPATTTQSTEWPRQGVVDYNGDTVNGIPKQIKAANAELAIRVLNGVKLQPDYDSTLAANGGVLSSVTKKVGPIETVFAYDTKLGLGFFASFPIVDRMLAKAGLLNSGGGRTVIR